MAALLVSLIAYALAAWWLRRRLDDYIEPGMLRRLLVFVLASVVSWGAGNAVDALFPGQALHLLSQAPTLAAGRPL